MYKNETILLNNNVTMPKMIFGTWRMKQRPDQGYAPVMSALNNGCLAIDTAQAYKTEPGIKKALKDCNIDRKNLFISTKLNPETVIDGNTANEAFNTSLTNLGLDYIDMMYIHAPSSWDKKAQHDNVSIYKVLEEKINDKKLRSIGLSNFTLSELTKLLENVQIKPQALQIQLSIGCEDKELVKYCQDNNITIIPYSPLASGYLLRNKEFLDFAKKINKDPVEIALDYVTQKYGTCLFGSENQTHITEILKLDKLLTPNEIEQLDILSTKIGNQNAWTYDTGWTKEKIPTSSDI